jgi:hypothetical protein
MRLWLDAQLPPQAIAVREIGLREREARIDMRPKAKGTDCSAHPAQATFRHSRRSIHDDRQYTN